MSENNPKTADEKDAEENKSVAALSYIWILFLIPLLAKRNSKFCQFHAKQGLIIFIGWLIAGLIGWIPLIGWLCVVAMLIISVIGIIKVLNGEYYKIPFVYDLSEKIKI